MSSEPAQEMLNQNTWAGAQTSICFTTLRCFLGIINGVTLRSRVQIFWGEPGIFCNCSLNKGTVEKVTVTLNVVHLPV